MRIHVGSGVYINVYDPNPSGKNPVVLLHGWPLNNKMFEYQYSTLADCRMVGIDLRGFGESDAPFSGYNYDTFSDDLLSVIKQLGLNRFTLAGFSMGGAVACRYMRRHRGLGVKRLVLISAAAPCFTEREDFPYGLDRREVTELIALGCRDRPRMIVKFGELFFSKDTGTEFKEWCSGLGLDASGIGTLQALRELRDADLRYDVGKISVPTDIIHGRLDRVCPYELGVVLNGMIPRSELHTLESSGHCVFYDQPDELNRLLNDIVKQL